MYKTINSRINKVDRAHAPEDPILTTMRFIPQHEVVQNYDAILPDNLTNQAMKESEAYKTYFAFATGKAIPKPNNPNQKEEATAKVQRLLSEVALTEVEQMKIALTRSKTQQHSSHASGSGEDEGTGVTSGVPDVPSYDSEAVQISWKSSDEEDEDDEANIGKDKDDDDQDNDDDQGANVEGDEQDEEETNEEVEANELYRDVNINLVRRDTEMTDTPRTIIQTTQVIKDTHVIITLVNPEDVPVTTIAPSSSLLNLPNFGSLFGSLSSIPNIIYNYLGSKLKDAVDVAVQLKSNKLRDEAQTENQDFINNLDAHMQKIIKEQVKAQVKKQVLKIFPRIKKLVNDQLESEVLIRSSNEANTSYAVAANLSELELKKILIDKMERNKSVDRSDIQKNLYKALVDAYEADKNILDTYGDTVTIKRRRDDADDDEEPSAGSDRGSKRRRTGKEPESTSAPKEKTSKTTGKSTKGFKSHHKSVCQSAQAEEPMHTAQDLEEPTHQEFETGVTEDQPNEETSQLPDWFQKPTRLTTPDRDWNKTLLAAHGPVQPWISTLAQKEDTRESFNELMDTPLDFSAFMMNRLKVDTLTLELLAGLTFELMKGSCKCLVELEYFFEEVYKATTDQLDWNNPEGQQYPHDLRKPLPLIPNSRGRRVIPFDHFINNDLEYLSGGVSSRKYITLVTKTKAIDYGHIKWIEDLVPNRMESARDVYSKRRIIVVTKIEIVEWHNYKHLDWITVRKLTNLTIEERLAFNISLRMFTRSIVIQRRVKDLQLGFIYQNKDKKNKLMCIDESHKFSDGTLNDVRTALNDHLKGIQMQYLPQTIWRESDRDKVGAMIQAIDKQLKTRRIMRSLEKFVGGRSYEGDFRLLQRTI
ncbi:hypothetical protein Tco_0667474 [Tanacetum coccineum]